MSVHSGQLSFKSVVAFAAFIAFAGVACAETTPAEQAGEMLARAHSINSKCNYLKAADKMRLMHLVQRAEQALTQRESADAAQAAMQRGREDGMASACSAAEKENLNLILGAANEATTPDLAKPAASVPTVVDNVPASQTPNAEQKSSPAAAPAPAPIAADNAPSAQAMAAHVKPIQGSSHTVEASSPINKLNRKQSKSIPKQIGSLGETAIGTGDHKPDEVLSARKPLRLVQQQTVKPKSDASLQAYAQITRDYYVARRCAPSDSHELGSMYQQIIVSHDSLMRSHGAGEVSAILRHSARAARAQSCG